MTLDKFERELTETSTLMPAVSLHLDILPLALFIAMALCLASVVASVKQQPVVSHKFAWALGAASATGGLLLIVLRGDLPPLASILFGNVLLLVGEALLACGASLYIGRRPVLDIAVGLTSLFVFAAAYFLDANVLVRVIVYTLACAYFAVSAATSFFQARKEWTNQAAGFVASLICIVELSRAGFIFADILSPSDKASINGFSVMFGVPIAMLIAVSVFVLHWDKFVQLFSKSEKLEFPEVDCFEQTPNDLGWTLINDRSVLRAPNGQELRLTGNEYLLLQKLADVGEVVDRLSLNVLIGRSEIDPKDRGIDILFSRLRRKCSEVGLTLPVNALRGRGYVFIGKLRRE